VFPQPDEPGTLLGRACSYSRVKVCRSSTNFYDSLLLGKSSLGCIGPVRLYDCTVICPNHVHTPVDVSPRHTGIVRTFSLYNDGYGQLVTESFHENQIEEHEIGRVAIHDEKTIVFVALVRSLEPMSCTVVYLTLCTC